MFEQIDVKKVKELLESGTVNVLDSRDAGSYQQGHLPKAALLTDQNTDRLVDDLDKTTALICYCYHGIGSQSVAAFFAGNGFEKVYSMKGGFEAWKKVYPSEVTGV